MSEINILSVQPTKEYITTVANNVIDLCADGQISPLELAVKLSAFDKICEQIRDGIRESVLTELDKQQGKATCLSAKVDRKETGVKYDYSLSEAWVKVKEQEEKISNKRKEVEALCKNCPEGSELQYTDVETGEVLTIKKAAKSSTTNFVVTLAK